MKKNFKSRKPSAKPANSVEQHSLTSATIGAGQTPKPISRIMKFAEVPEGSELNEKYLAIAGQGRPLDEPVASNLSAANQLAVALLEDVKQHASAASYDIGLQIQCFGATPGSNAEIDIPAARKAARLYKNAGVDAIAAIRLYPAPCSSDPRGFEIVSDIVTILFGTDARTAISQANSKSRSRNFSGLAHSAIDWLDPNDDDALKYACNQLMIPRLTGLPKTDSSSPILLPEGWDSGEARALRGLVTLMCLSMLPMKKKLIVAGEGKPMVTGAIADAEHRLGKLCKGTPPIIHRDGIPHFWFSELRRLGLDDISVPLIKLR